jgi:hypothetical protein
MFYEMKELQKEIETYEYKKIENCIECFKKQDLLTNFLCSECYKIDLQITLGLLSQLQELSGIKCMFSGSNYRIRR